MGSEKYAKALDKLIDAREEIARLTAALADRDKRLAEAREVVGDLLGDTQHVDHECGDTLENCPVLRARAFVDRGA